MPLSTFVCGCFQIEQLVDKQILIDRLRSDVVTFQGATTGAAEELVPSGTSSKRPHSVPLIRHSCGQGPRREVGSCTVLFWACNCLCVSSVPDTLYFACDFDCLKYQTVLLHIFMCVHTLCCSWLCIFTSGCMCVCRFTPVPQPIHWRECWQPLRCAVISFLLSLRKRMRCTVHS